MMTWTARTAPSPVHTTFLLTCLLALARSLPVTRSTSAPSAMHTTLYATTSSYPTLHRRHPPISHHRTTHNRRRSPIKLLIPQHHPCLVPIVLIILVARRAGVCRRRDEHWAAEDGCQAGVGVAGAAIEAHAGAAGEGDGEPFVWAGL